VALTNHGGLAHPRASPQELDELASLLQVPMVAGSVCRGSALIGAGLVVNDWTGMIGASSTATEISVVDSIFKLGGMAPGEIPAHRDALIEAYA